MLLHNVHHAVIEPAKLRDHLLNPDHPDNRGKATVLFAVGFSRDDWPLLETAIRALIQTNDAELSDRPAFLPRYLVLAHCTAQAEALP